MRKFLLILSILAIAMVLLFLALPYVLDVNQYKSQISTLIEKQTGRKVRLDGEIQLELFPPIGLNVKEIHLLKPKSDEDLAYIGNLTLKVELWPLLERDIQVKSLVMEEVKAWLAIDASGKGNWEVAAAPTKAKKADAISSSNDEVASQGEMMLASAPSPTSENPDEAAAGEVEVMPSTSSETQAKEVNLKLDEIIIRNAMIDVKDAMSKRQVTLENLALKADFDAGKSNLDISGVIAQLPKEHQRFSVGGLLELLPAGGVKAQNMKIMLGKIDAKLNLEMAQAKNVTRLEGGLYLNDVNITPYVAWLKGEVVADTRRKWWQPFALISSAHAQEKQASKASSSFGWSTEPIDISAIKNYQGHFGLYFDGLQYQQHRFGKGDIYSHFQFGDLSVKIKELAWLGGDVAGDVLLKNTASKGLAFTSDIKATQIDLSALPADVKQQLYDPSGRVNLNANLKGQGLHQKQLVASLNGTTSLEVNEAAFATLADMLQSKINNPLFNAAMKPYRQSFGNVKQLTANWNVVNGVMKNDDFRMQSSPISFIGKGELNLPAQQIYYRFEPLRTDDGVKVNFAGVQMPDILLKGALTAPEVKLDGGDTVRDLIKKGLSEDGIKDIKRELMDNRRGVVEDLKKNLEKNGLKNLLQGL